jgi:uncharacterized protein with GYD domain
MLPVRPLRQESIVQEKCMREEFNTGFSKIKQEIKSLLVSHGLYGSVTAVETGDPAGVPSESRIEISAKGRTASRSFNRDQIEHCCLRVGGDVLADIKSMVAELSSPSRS